MLLPNRHFIRSKNTNPPQKSTLFAVSKDEWHTKEDTGRSMKNALYILQYAKGTSQAEAASNSEKIKPVALAVVELCLSEGISQLLSQLVSRKFR